MWIGVIGVYAIIRFCCHRIAGIYMFKKLGLAAILVIAAYETERKWWYIFALIGLETLFMIARLILERSPSFYSKTDYRNSHLSLASQGGWKCTIIFEWLLICIGYAIMFFVLVSGVTVFICMFIVFILLALLISDLARTYLSADNHQDDFFSENGDQYFGQNPESERKMMG